MKTVQYEFLYFSPYLKSDVFQELEFIGGLIKYGKLQQGEVEAVLNMLFPTKSDAEIKDIMTTLYGEQIPLKKGTSGR